MGKWGLRLSPGDLSFCFRFEKGILRGYVLNALMTAQIRSDVLVVF